MISVTQQSKVRIVSLDSPPANVLNLALLQRLGQEISAAGADPQTRCLVLASSIPRYFSTGLDLAEMMTLPEDRRAEPFMTLLGTYRQLRALGKPTLAAIGGSAILGGWIVALGCDFRLISDDGRIALSEVRFGLSPTEALIGRMREISTHPGLVKEMVLRGRTLRAAEALAGGFVDQVVPAADLRAEAEKEARQLAKLAPPAYASIKGALSGLSAAEDEARWLRSRAEFDRLFATPEALEGISAMRDKRRPRWED